MRAKGALHRSRERGSGLAEFALTAPVLLVIAGATLDLSRYISSLQVSSFVSQELAKEVYKECSDITIFNNPTRDTTTLTVDTIRTAAAIQRCADNAQDNFQNLLNNSLPGAVALTYVLRWDLANSASISQAACATAMTAPLPTIIFAAPKKSDIKSTLGTPCSNSGPDNSGCHRRNPNSQPLKDSLFEKNLTVSSNNQIVQTRNNVPRIITGAAGLCRKNREVAVEIGYAFEPIVRFLPNISHISFDEDGIHRETTIL